VSRLNSPAQWVIQEVPDLGIVELELRQVVKARQQQVRHGSTGAADRLQPVWDRQRPRYLFSGLMRCGCCGGGYSKISGNLFGCSTARNKGPTACTNRLNIRRDVIEATVLNGLKEHLMAPELFKEFCTEFHQELNRLRRDEMQSVERVRAELVTVERRIAKLVAALADGMPVRAVKDELVRLEAHLDELQRQLARAPEPQPLLHPGLAEVYRARVADLHRALENGDAMAEAMDLIRSLVDEIVLTPEQGELRIDLRGEFAGILALCADKRKPGSVSGAGLAEQVKMVAKAGFEPATFTL
jgi:site-specific DNA recombinase